MSKPKADWCCYLLVCSDSTYYCGITNDLAKRLEKHNNGTGAKYTRGRIPVRIIAVRTNLTKSKSAKLERKVKGVNKSQKVIVLKTLPLV